jgi:hypothetical protein
VQRQTFPETPGYHAWPVDDSNHIARSRQSTS